MKNKRGWIRVVEVFVALLMITSVSLIAINKDYQNKEDSSSNIFKIENFIIKNIQYEDSIRDDILNQETLPVEWENFPANLKNAIESGTPSYLECKAKLCSVWGECEMESLPEKDIYVQHIPITSNIEKFKPVILKLGCWKNN